MLPLRHCAVPKGTAPALHCCPNKDARALAHLCKYSKSITRNFSWGNLVWKPHIRPAAGERAIQEWMATAIARAGKRDDIAPDVGLTAPQSSPVCRQLSESELLRLHLLAMRSELLRDVIFTSH